MNHLQYLGGLRRHYIVIPALGLGYGRVPKAANSMLKRHLARAAGIEDLFGGAPTSRDQNWRMRAPHAHFLTAAEAKRRFPDILLFSFVRHPLDRLGSCYRSKIERPETVTPSLRREGLSKSVDFAGFVRHVARRADWRSNIHYRSQSHILRGKGGLAPDFIGRLEQLDADWARLSEIVAARGGMSLPPLPQRRGRRAREAARASDLFAGDQELIRLAQRRYAADLRLFYGDVSAESAPK